VQGTDEAPKAPGETLAKAENPNGAIPPNWSRRLALGLLRREAEHWIPAPGTKPEQSRSPGKQNAPDWKKVTGGFDSVGAWEW
jgi:hypothetical protein